MITVNFGFWTNGDGRECNVKYIDLFGSKIYYYGTFLPFFKNFIHHTNASNQADAKDYGPTYSVTPELLSYKINNKDTYFSHRLLRSPINLNPWIPV